MPEANPSRIGVYVCHCGKNIAGVINCEEVAQFASKLPNVVVSKDYDYMCSELGQQLIKKDAAESNLNRVVVASCSPKLHEPTFRKVLEEARLNPYLFEMANIREHCSWVHLRENEKATEKAKDLVDMAVSKARLLEPQQRIGVPVKRSVLVIGGGVAGIQASLDLADQGYKVYLVEREPTIGGHMAMIDKTFPTMDCSICILAPKMADVARHPNIELLTYSEVLEVSGFIGNYKVKILKKPTYIKREDCDECGDCADACPVEVPDEFNQRLSWRKAIYLPFPQAVPTSYVLDEDTCLGLVPLACSKCREACERRAIDYDMQPETLEVEVGAIVVGTGYQAVSSSKLGKYGYGTYDDVITTLEFERLINAAGPTEGELIRLSNHQRPKRVAFIQCVGSRDQKAGNTYCSNICCMETIKDCLLIKEHWPETEIAVFYTDLRAFGKRFEELLQRAREEGVLFVRGKTSNISEDPQTKRIIIEAENTLLNRPITYEADLLILSIGLEPMEDAGQVQRVLTVPATVDGFLLESHPKLKPVDSPMDGIFICGCAESPKDIKETVTQASAAAGRTSRLLSRGTVEVEPITPFVDMEKCTKCGLCAKACPYGAITVKEIGKTPAGLVEAACKGCGTCVAECHVQALDQRNFTNQQIITQIEAALRVGAEDKILAFCCNWCSYGGADLAGVSRMQYPTNIRIIRVMCSGRVRQDFILKAFELGAGMVLVSGCHPQDCHYISGNRWCEKRIDRLRKKLEGMGIDPSRLRLEWVSADEGRKFANIVKAMTEDLTARSAA